MFSIQFRCLLSKTKGECEKQGQKAQFVKSNLKQMLKEIFNKKARHSEANKDSN
jgi:hypothetical protein